MISASRLATEKGKDTIDRRFDKRIVEEGNKLNWRLASVFSISLISVVRARNIGSVARAPCLSDTSLSGNLVMTIVTLAGPIRSLFASSRASFSRRKGPSRACRERRLETSVAASRRRTGAQAGTATSGCCAYQLRLPESLLESDLWAASRRLECAR